MEKMTRERALKLSKSLAYRLIEASKEYKLSIENPEKFKKNLGSSFFKDLENLGVVEEPITEEEQVLPLEEELGTMAGIPKFELKKEEELGTMAGIPKFELSKDEEFEKFQMSRKEGTANADF